MSLAKSSSQKPATEAKSWEKAQSPPCITFQMRNGESLIIPFSQVLWIRAKFSEEKDQVIIRTNYHEISLKGNNLGELVRLLSEFQIRQIHECSGRRAKLGDGRVENCTYKALQDQ